MKSYVQTMQVYSGDEDELEATITCVDQGVYKVELISMHSIDTWKALAQEVEACINLMDQPL